MIDKAKSNGTSGNVRVNKGREHMHGGLLYAENSVIENLRDDQIVRLEKNKIATRTTDKAKSASA